MNLRCLLPPKSVLQGCAALLLAVSLAQASVLTREFTFSPRQFQFESGQRLAVSGQPYDIILGEGMDVTDEPGAPQLPVQPIVIALPGRCRVTSVTFEVGKWQTMGGRHNLLPAQRQQVLVAGTEFGQKSKVKGQISKGKGQR